jgi:hypothetical protein
MPMTSTVILSLALALSPAQAPAKADPPRKPHPLAPSLPLLTKEEEDKIDEIIDRFIQFDIGRLPGPEGQKALEDFKKLGPEAFFALIRGLNRAAGIESSCPAVTIAKKLLPIIRGANDPALLAFARENIGLGVQRSPHMGVIKDLRMVALIRAKDAAKGKPAAPADSDGKIVIRPRKPGDTSIGNMTTFELAQQAKTAKGDKLKDILNELAQRPSESAIAALVASSGPDVESQIRYLAQELLLKNLSRLPADSLKDKLADKRPEVRSAAAWVVAEKKLRFGAELIELLNDKDADVVQAARQALHRLAGDDIDYGPNRAVPEAERAEAVRQWREWWAKQSGQ